MEEVELKSENALLKNPVIKLVVDLVNGILITIGLAVTGVGVAAYFITKKTFNIAFLIVSGFTNGIYYLFLQIIEKIVVICALVAIVVGSGYYILESNPGLKRNLSRILGNVERITGRLSNLPILSEINGFFAGANRLERQLNGEVSGLVGRYGKDAIPKELYPLLSIALNPSSENQLGQLLSSGALGGGDLSAALPFLEQALQNPDKAVQGAAFDSLNQIGGRDAKRIIKQYEGLLKNSTKNLQLR